MTREEKLAGRIEHSDMEAVEELIRIYYPEIFRYCLWHAPNRILAEDAVQETFLKAIRYTERYTFHGKFKSFLYKIAANTCIDMRRKKWTTEEALEDLDTEPQYMENGFEEVEEDLQLRRLVRNLKAELQEIEAVTRMSFTHIFLAEMITIVIGDAVMIGTVTGIIAWKVSYGISSSLLYLLVPSLAMWCVVFRLLRHVKIEKIPICCSVMCFFVLLTLLLLDVFYPACYDGRFSARWAGICIGLLFFCVYQWKKMIKNSKGVVAWN